MRIANITFPKAGSQWLRDLLTDARVLPAEIQDAGTLGIRQVSTFAALPDRTLVAPFYSVRRELWERYSERDDRAVVLIRDPRDMLVSWLFSALYSHGSNEPNVSYLRPILARLALRDQLAVALPHAPAGPIETWTTGQTPNTLLIRYEELLENTRATFDRILQFLEWEVETNVLDAVIAEHSFESRSGRARGTVDVQSHYRSGVAGDWRNYFDRDFGRTFEALMPGLLVASGYEQRNDWWTKLGDAAPRQDEPNEIRPETFLAAAVAERDRRLAAVQAEADARNRALDALSVEANRLRDAATERGRLLLENDAALRELERVATERAEVIAVLDAEVQRQRTIIELLQSDLRGRAPS